MSICVGCEQHEAVNRKLKRTADELQDENDRLKRELVEMRKSMAVYEGNPNPNHQHQHQPQHHHHHHHRNEDKRRGSRGSRTHRHQQRRRRSRPSDPEDPDDGNSSTDEPTESITDGSRIGGCGGGKSVEKSPVSNALVILQGDCLIHVLIMVIMVSIIVILILLITRFLFGGKDKD